MLPENKDKAYYHASCTPSWVYTWVDPAKRVPMGGNGANTKSWLNSAIFINAWKIILESKIWVNAQYIVKADPDAVFFPDRLVAYLGHAGAWHHKENQFAVNCNFQGKTKLFGALEVFTHESIYKFNNQFDDCKSQLPWKEQGMGEDEYMEQCMLTVIKAKSNNLEELMQDNACGMAK